MTVSAANCNIWEEAMDKTILNQANDYYTAKLLEHGETSLGLDWNSKAAQTIRFDQITKIIQDPSRHFSICDYGCGIGDYNDYLAERFSSYDYYGLDISEKMIETAKRRHPSAQFSVTFEPTTCFDYLVSSGIFNVRQSVSDADWLNYILESINLFHRYTKRGFAFNCLTKYSDEDHKKDYLYYADPLFLFDYCKTKFSKNVALLHDYKLYDFTILVRKEDI